ncbi:MAG: KGK domain-containing protein [Xenococcaceae cyanobacterium MO_188.B32]|nr:KGK domain-containing protein [Xenococcaceae cyanobacterium MO_188.B32]
MEENFKLEKCSENDALEFSSGAYRTQNIIAKIKEVFNNKLTSYLYTELQQRKVDIQPYKNWFSNGIDCEILKVGSTGWQKGKVRLKVSLEFIADEPEEVKSDSPLDDIRQAINE